VTGMDGGPFDPTAAHLIASNDHVHGQVLAVIEEFRKERTPKRTK